MGSQGQATAQQDDAVGTTARVPRPRRPGLPPSTQVSDALGRAINRSSRLDTLTQELRDAGGRGRTSSWLAERLGVSARTIKRDVMALQQAGVPIRATSGPQGGYVIDPTGQRPLTLTADEALAAVVGLQAVPDQPFASARSSAVAKILRSVAPERRAEVAQLADRVWIRPGEPPAHEDGSVRQILTDALRDRRVVLIDYEPADSPDTVTEQVEPLGFAHSRGLWFALAWSRDHDAGRWFQLDHIRAAQSTHEKFDPRDVREVFSTPS
ncbi:helix-turn-helix transcriptional regulator [Jiangella asiatica]|nr:WYL domain-containing protein [Jiangella asiatica]